MQDVAQRSGVSTATVSRVFNGPAGVVRPATVRKVMAAAEELGFEPNMLARAFRQKRSNVWALIVADIENPFLTSVTRGVEAVAQAAGYAVLLFNADEDAAKETQYLRIAEQSRAAGVLITPTSGDVDVSRLLERGTPVVALDRPLKDQRADSVLVDSYGAAAKAVGHLLEEGHRRIACITGPKGGFTAEARLDGWRAALINAGMEPDETLVRYTDFKIDGGAAAMRSLLAKGRPDALLVANSLLAVGVLQVLNEHGLAVGDDVGVVAFDDAPWTRLVSPHMTVVRQPAEELGRAAAQLLLARLDGQDGASRTLTLNAHVVPALDAYTPGAFAG